MWLKRWEIFIIILAIINSVQVPIELAFYSEAISEFNAVLFFNFLVDILFLIDMILQFFSTYIDKEGIQIFDSKMIARKYVRSTSFVADALAVIGGSSFMAYWDPSLQLLNSFKIVRVSRLSTFILKLSVHKNLKAVLSLIKLIFYLLLFVHCLACGWIIIVTQNKGNIDESGRRMYWIPPLDFLNYKDSDFFDENNSKIKLYFECYYHAVLVVGTNEMGPVNRLESIYIAFALLISNVVNA